MSEIKVDKISPQSGTALAVGDSGDTITIPSGATITNNGTANGFSTAGADTSLSNLAAAGEKLVPQAWMTFDGTGTISITDSGGINPFSSLTDVAVGQYGLTFTSAMANTTYCTMGSSIGSSSGGYYFTFVTNDNIANTTTYIRIATQHHLGHHVDQDVINVSVFGD